MSFLENIAKDGVYENTLVLLPLDILVTYNDFDTLSGTGIGATATKSIPSGLIPSKFYQSKYRTDGTLSPYVLSSTPTYYDWSEVYPFTSTLSTAQWSFDYENKLLYIKSIPPNIDYFKITCVLPISIKPINWHIDPLDSSSRVVRYKPYLSSEVEVKSSLKDRLSSSSPIFSGGFSVDNSTGFMDEVLSLLNTKATPCDVYRISGNPSVENTRKIVSFILEDINVQGTIVNFQADQDDLNIKMVQEIDNYSEIDPPLSLYDLELNRGDEKIPFVFGHARGIKCFPIDYKQSGSAISDNRGYVACHIISDLTSSVSSTGATLNSGKTIISGSVLTDAQGKLMYRLGDRIRVVQGAYTSYPIISAINLGTPSITISSALGGSFSAGSINVSRTMCSRVFINQSDTPTEIMPFRDYTTNTITISSYMIRRISLTSSAESNVGISTINAGASPDSYVVAHVYGPRYDSVSGPIDSIGSTDIKPHINLPAAAHPVAIIYLILRTVAFVSDDEIDLVSFENLLNYEPVNQSPVSFIDPIQPTNDRSKVKDIINGICQSYDLLLFKNNENKWKVVRNSAAPSKEWIVRKKDILNEELEYEHDYQRIFQTINMSYDINNNPSLSGEESGFRVYTEHTKLGYPYYFDESIRSLLSYAAPYSYSQASAVPTHNLGTTGPYKVAQNIANLDGIRKIVYKVRLRKAFLPVDYGDIIVLKLERIPGFRYVKVVENTVRCRVLSILRTTNYIELELEDSRYEESIGYDSDTYI